MAAVAVSGRAHADTVLPAAVRAALANAQVPPDALSALIVDADGSGEPRLAWRSQVAVNPASLFKLVTTYAALDLLGPGFTWATPVWLDGSVRDGVLDGSLVIKGQGDPRLVAERVWLLLRRVQQMGVREIRGDIVLDRSAFTAADGAPADFDGEPLRPYNAKPDALLLSYRSVVYTFTPDPARGIARVGAEPSLAGLRVDAEVPLSAGACGDWRAGLKASPGDPNHMRLAGSYPASCGERSWALAYADPASHAGRMLQAMWRDLGGRLGGTVRDGVAPATPPSFEVTSPPLAEIVRDINKHSNNVMAQQLLLTLGWAQRGIGSADAGRTVLRQWLTHRLGPTRADAVVVDNGSGLSRETRISAESLVALLQSAWRGPLMPELLASLPVAGVDGTLRRTRVEAGRAHLKTGSLRDVAGIAGVVHADGGSRMLLVAVINHPNANRARAALDALVQWALGDAGQPR